VPGDAHGRAGRPRGGEATGRTRQADQDRRLQDHGWSAGEAVNSKARHVAAGLTAADTMVRVRAATSAWYVAIEDGRQDQRQGSQAENVSVPVLCGPGEKECHAHFT